MTKKEIEQLNQTLSIIIGTPLQNLTRSGAMLIFDFGEVMEVNSFMFGENGGLIRNENGKPIPTKRMRGRYILTSLCSMRFSCGNDVIFASSDMFLPTEELAYNDDFDWNTFNWQVHGNSLFDELKTKHFRGEFNEYIVKSVKVGKFGDLMITFENNFVLEFFADGSSYSENWRFGEINSSDSLVVSSKGMINEDMI